MLWTIIILLVLFTGLKFAISWLIKNRTADLASWAVFWIVFVFSGFFILFAKIQSDEAIKQTEIAITAQQEAQHNAEEAYKQSTSANAVVAESEAALIEALNEANKQRTIALTLAKQLEKCK